MLYLASKSLARQKLLTAAGVAFEVIASPLNEENAKQALQHETPKILALHLAKQKAEAVADVTGADLVLAADQTLSWENGTLHKSSTVDEARQTLKALRGKTHHLHSAIAVSRRCRTVFHHVSTAELTMREFTDDFLEDYMVNAGDALTSSVGCYHYEGLGIQLFKSVEGDHATILGLPILPLLEFLRETGELKQ
jgi:septum formation protein